MTERTLHRRANIYRQRDGDGGIGIAYQEVVVDESPGLPRDDLGPLRTALSQPLPAHSNDQDQQRIEPNLKERQQVGEEMRGAETKAADRGRITSVVTHPRSRRARGRAGRASADSVSPPAPVVAALGADTGSEKTPKAMSARRAAETRSRAVSATA